MSTNLSKTAVSSPADVYPEVGQLGPRVVLLLTFEDPQHLLSLVLWMRAILTGVRLSLGQQWAVQLADLLPGSWASVAPVRSMRGRDCLRHPLFARAALGQGSTVGSSDSEKSVSVVCSFLKLLPMITEEKIFHHRTHTCTALTVWSLCHSKREKG